MNIILTLNTSIEPLNVYINEPLRDMNQYELAAPPTFSIGCHVVFISCKSEI